MNWIDSNRRGEKKKKTYRWSLLRRTIHTEIPKRPAKMCIHRGTLTEHHTGIHKRSECQLKSVCWTTLNEVKYCVLAMRAYHYRWKIEDARPGPSILFRREYLFFWCAPRMNTRRKKKRRKTTKQKSIPFPQFTIMVYQAIDKLCTLSLWHVVVNKQW